MPRQANGNYLPPANTAAVTGTTISSSAYNTLETDIGTEITNSVDRGGRSAMTAALPMGGQKITGMADPTVATDGATKNYVDTTTASFFSTGDVKFSIKSSPDTSWVLMDDRTIGSATSGATNRANADTQALFTLLFNNISDTYAPIQTSGGGATTRAAQVSASAAWAANCRIALLIAVGRAMGIAGSGSGLTTRPLGGSGGAETVVLGTTNLPPYTPAGTIAGAVIFTNSTQTWNQPAGSTRFDISTSGGLAFTGTPQGGTSTPVSILQPTTFINAMMKL